MDDRAAGVIAHLGKMPVWMAAGGDRPSEEEEDDIFDRSVTLPVDEEGNVKIDGSNLAQLITHRFAKGNSVVGEELTEAQIDAI
jgi:hypothetical protein